MLMEELDRDWKVEIYIDKIKYSLQTFISN